MGKHQKRDRRPSRTKGILRHLPPPAGVPNATPKEVATAIASCCWCLKDVNENWAPVLAGRCIDYDPIKDVYTVIGKNSETMKVGDYKVDGASVSELIFLTRMANGGALRTDQLIHTVGGIDKPAG